MPDDTIKEPTAARKEAARLAAEDAILIAVEKDGERIRVHPTTLAKHEAKGWKRV